MQLPMSKTALDRLGERMAAAEPVAADDQGPFRQVAAVCQEAAEYVRVQLAEIGYAATPRVKTTGTLVDKLRRQRTRLSQVQDLAGVRFVVADRLAQDEAVASVCAHFEAQDFTCKTDDLRDDPSFGYRAVHVIVQLGQVRVEVQVRTELQDIWAQLVEYLGDTWGRAIRYGGEPENPDAKIRSGELVVSRRAAMRVLGSLSDLIATIERHRASLVRSQERLDRLKQIVQDVDELVAGYQAHDEPVPEEDRAVAEAVTSALGVRPTGSVNNLIVADLQEAARRGQEQAQRSHDELAEMLRSAEAQLRDTLQLIANAATE